MMLKRMKKLVTITEKGEVMHKVETEQMYIYWVGIQSKLVSIHTIYKKNKLFRMAEVMGEDNIYKDNCAA